MNAISQDAAKRFQDEMETARWQKIYL
jgi:hypothetical protein